MSDAIDAIVARHPEAFDERQRPVCGLWSPMLGPCICGVPGAHDVAPSDAKRVYGEGMSNTPLPFLSYPMWLYDRDKRPTPDGVITLPGEQALFNVHDVHASRDGDGLRVSMTGAMRRKDGTQGAHNRGARVSVDDMADQPAWMAAIIADATKRLWA